MQEVYNTSLNSEMYTLVNKISNNDLLTSSRSILIYIVQGEATLEVNDKPYTLYQEEFILANRGDIFTIIKESKNIVYCLVYLPTSLIRTSLGTNNYYFTCNSAVQTSMDHSELKLLVNKLVSLSIVKESPTVGVNLETSAVYYNLLNLLIQKYSEVSNNDLPTNTEFLDVIDYIHTNYFRKLTLDEVSDYSYLSKSYFSRLFKKEMGVNFVNYLNEYRVNQSLGLLSNTDKSITQIALDVGFSSTSSYNVCFKEMYQKTPTDYRNEVNEVNVEKNKEIRISLENVKENDNGQLMNLLGPSPMYEKYKIGLGNRISFNMSVNEYMNVGHIKNLVDGKFQRHLNIMTETLSLKGFIITDVFDSIDSNRRKPDNFKKYRTVYDFLFENKFRSIIEVPINLNTLEFIEGEIENFVIYLLGHYNASTLDYFNFNLIVDIEGEITTSVETAKNIIHSIKKHLPRSMVGAPGIELNTLTSAEKYSYCISNLNIDFVSCSFFDRISTRVGINVKQYVEIIREMIPQDRKELINNIYITEYNTYYNKNYVHDSNLKAAQIVFDLTQMIDLVRVVAYAPISDFVVDYVDENMILDGGYGLLTSHGIYKPAFFAFKFMSHLGSEFLTQSKQFIATTTQEGVISILSHNYNQSAIDKDVINKYFDNKNIHELNSNQSMVLNLQIKDIENGQYEIRTYSINEKYGSLMTEWSKWDYLAYFRKSDIDFLRNKVHPHLSIKTVDVINNSLYIDIHLESNEICIVYVDRVKR